MYNVHIRRAIQNDADSICALYNAYVLHSTVTFETTAVSIPDMRQRIDERLANHDWLVAELDRRVTGYAYYGPFRPRAAYSRTVESTVYVSPEFHGKGIGKSLYSALIQSAQDKYFRELIGVIALPNPASLQLHRTLGFREAGVLLGVGQKFGQFIDVSFWQKHLSHP